MAASATAIVGAATAIDAYLNTLALILIVSFDNYMLKFLNTVNYVDPNYHTSVLKIRLKVNDNIKQNLKKLHRSNEIVVITSIVIVVYGLIVALINVYV